MWYNITIGSVKETAALFQYFCGLQRFRIVQHCINKRVRTEFLKQLMLQCVKLTIHTYIFEKGILKFLP